MSLAICCAALPAARAGALSAAAQYNVFTLGNFTTSGNGDTQGALAAAGVVTINNYAVGFSSSSSFFNLVAGTNLVASNGSANGKVYDAGSGGIAGSFTIAPGSLTTGGTDPIDFSDAATHLRATSSGLAGMSTAGDSCAFMNYYWLTCTATQHGLNVINLPAADLAYLNTSYGFQVNSTYSDATIVINVPSTSDSTPNNWGFSGIGAQNVLLNFSSATNLTLSSYVAASVLAPNAAVTAPSPGHLDGTFIAGSFTSGQYQFNAQLFTGTLPDFSYSVAGVATPEPASLALVGSSLIALAFLCSKARKK
jgi:choice-of-anchor A domain-containing protein